jgi:thiamine biosynthesis lipoprotein
MPSVVSRRNFLTFDFARRGAAEDLVTLHRIAMACRVEVTLPAAGGRDIGAAREALDEADRLEGVLSVFRDTSDVVRVNRCAAGEAVPVRGELFDLVALSSELHARTDGAFDVTSGPLSRCWGFLQRDARLPDPAQLAAARAVVGMRSVILDGPARTVRFERRGMELNFGSIGKGFVLDRMADLLQRRGVRHAIASAGSSSIVAIGGRDRGWPIDLRPRRAHKVVGRIRLRNGAVGTSGAGEQFVEIDGSRYGHVLDPRSGAPAAGTLAASVITRSGAVADALSTAFLVGGADLAERYCVAHADTLAVIVPENGAPQTFGRYPGALMEMCSD